jgi:hypothetical protein
MLRCVAELTDHDVSKEHLNLLASQTTRTPTLNVVQTSNPVSGTHIALTDVRTYIHTHMNNQTSACTHKLHSRLATAILSPLDCNLLSYDAYQKKTLRNIFDKVFDPEHH